MKPTIFKSILIMIRQDMLVTWRQAFSWLTPLIFFSLVICLFPLSLGPDSAVLNKISAGIIWLAAILAILISIGNLFRKEDEEGMLEQLLLSAHPLPLIILSKTFSHWLTHCLPLIILSPLFGLLLNLNFPQECSLVFTLLLGTPILILIGAIGSALTVRIQSNGLLLPILIMPLYIPVLVFGTGSVMLANSNPSFLGNYAILAGLLFFTLALAPLITSIALKVGVNQ